MRNAIALLPLIVLAGCDLCHIGYGREGLLDCIDPRAPDQGLAPPPPPGCWGQLPPDIPLPTRAAAHPTPVPTAELCGRGPLYLYSAACVESDAPGGPDAVDNDCDGTIDEGGPNDDPGYPAPPPVTKSSAWIFADPYRWTVDARGLRCDGAAPCDTVVAHVEYHCGHGFHPTFDGRLTVLDRGPAHCLDTAPGVCGADAAHVWLRDRVAACSAAARTVTLDYDGFELHLTRLESSDIREPPRFTVDEYLADLHAALACVVAATVTANTFGGAADDDGDAVADGCDRCPGADDLADRDGDGVPDPCDRCPDHPDPDQLDADGDGLGDACDCERLDPLPPADAPLAERYCWDAEARPEYGGVPGRWICPPGAREKQCDPYPSTNAWLEEAVIGDLPHDDALYEASAFDYLLGEALPDIAGADPLCPPGLGCDAVALRAQHRGYRYEDYLCRRLLRKHDGAVECRAHPDPAQRHPSYRTEALIWHLPSDLTHDRAHAIIRPAGRLRYPDYVTRGRNVIVLGEAKCYDPVVPWNARSAWMWYRAVAFGTQLDDYTTKVVMSRRGAGPRYSTVYHFCSGTPGWVARLIAAAMAKTQADGFTLNLNDNGGRRFVTEPVCWQDGLPLAVAQTAFACYVPGEVAPEGVSPAWDCAGVFYDRCTGSE
ncbi:MAG: hypothetical protein H6705_18205 [Myxococcales bacterium]|nr:hypothetical protein [Myxococcales bacterium]